MNRLLKVFFVLMMGAATVNAASIAMNFIENASNQVFSGEELIGPTDIDSSNWNSSADSSDLANGTLSDMVDDSGMATTANVTWVSPNTWYNGSGTGSDEAKLTVGFLDDSNGGAYITVSDIPYEVYNVYVLLNITPSTSDFFHSDVIVNGVQYFNQGGYFPVHAGVVDGTGWVECDGTVYGNYLKVSGEIGTELVVDSIGYLGGIEGEPYTNARGGISGIIIEEVPVTTYNRIPENRKDLVPLDQVLSWEVGEGVTTIDLYLGEDPNCDATGDLRLDSVAASTVTYDATGVLDFDKTYYWRIDTYNSANRKTEGYVTSFITKPATPVVGDVQPAIVAVRPGYSQTLTVSTLYQDTCQWYKDGQAISDNGIYSGTNSDTLEILSMADSAVGVYTCVATNPAGSVTSNVGGEVVKGELLMHYPFDEVIYDSQAGSVVTPDIASGVDLSLQGSGPVNSIEGVYDGIAGEGSILFDNSDESDPNASYTYASAEGFDFGNKLKSSITVEFWAAMIDGGLNYSGDTPFWASQSDSIEEKDPRAMNVHLPWGNNITWNTENGDELTVNINDNPSIPLGSSDWHYWVFTKDCNSGVMKIYIDGELLATKTDTFTLLNSFKWISIAELDYFSGYLDDMKVYNYARTTDDIAQDYMAATGAEYVCDKEGNADLTYDFDNNCRVDILDFATFASTWLNDNRIYSNR